MKKIFISSVALTFTLFTCLALGKEEAFTVRATDVKDQPFSDAATRLQLAENVKVEVLSRKGSWMQISTQDLNGWIKMLSLRFENKGPSQTAANENNGLKSLYNLATTGSSGSTVTTATRSLDEKKFVHTSANPQALASMRALSVSKTDAQKFASLEKRTVQNLDYVAANGSKQ